MNAPLVDFKSAMRRLTATVSVVSCTRDGEWFGMTATAITSVCADPPTVLVCVNGAAAIHNPLVESGRFCVNVLRIDQQEISVTFGGKLKGRDRFGVGDWSLSFDGIPVLTGAQANIVASAQKVVPFGTHSVIIGAVDRVLVSEKIAPLLYENGRYMRSAELVSA